MLPAERSRALHDTRMHRVLAYIDAHLDESLELTTLAEVAAYSPFHFHRVFAAWHGERLGDYLRRRRLETAATRLASQPALTILELAVGVGFGSAEAFSRAFRQHFGASPSAWRRAQRLARKARADRKLDQTNRKWDQVPKAEGLNNRDAFAPPMVSPALPSAMPVQLQTLPPTSVAYLRYTGPYGPAVADFWMLTVAPWLATQGWLDQPQFGISHDDPSITAPTQCRYDACVERPPHALAPPPAQHTLLPGGRYAVMDFHGSVEHIADAWASLLRDWLPSSGLQLDARPCFEHYPPGSRMDPETGHFRCQLCIPVAPFAPGDRRWT